MYIIAIAWIYVIGMLALSSSSLALGATLFLGAGVAPLALLAWIGSMRRCGRDRRSVMHQGLDDPDGPDPHPDQQHLLNGGTQVHPLVQTRDQVGNRDVDHARGDEPQQ